MDVVVTPAAGPGDDAPLMVRRSRRRPALDGLRALAVAAVVVYHLDSSLLPGGFVGVDLFFVLSGYLITGLLLQEHVRNGSVSLRSFWKRRVRRLWPFAWVVLATVALAGLFSVWDADQQRKLGAQTAASLLNVANWWQLNNGGYTEQFVAPSPLRHFWSLAVEEQFYLIWPLLLIGLLALAARRGRWVLWAGILALSASSIVVAYTSTPERAYLGTDSRGIALLVGAALAVAWQDRHLAGPTSPAGRRITAVAAVAGTVVLAWAAAVATPEVDWLHHGGFTLIALAAVAVIASAVTNTSTKRALAWAPLVWIGERSYGIYLIHWPLIVALGPDRPLAVRAVLVVGASLVLAALVHRWLERPVMTRAVSTRLLGVAGVSMLALMVGALVLARPTVPTPEEQVGATLGRVKDPAALASSGRARSGRPATTTTTTCVPTTAPVPVFGSGETLDRSTMSDVADPTASCGTQTKVLVLGDSTGRGISNGLNALGDARIQVWDRTTLGCGLGPEKCPDWRQAWAAAVQQAQPEVVVIYTTIDLDLKGVDDAAFLSPEAARQRVAVMTEAVRIAGSTGAKVLLVVPPRPTGIYYCTGKEKQTTCDPAWAEAWAASVRGAAAATGAGVVEAGRWVDARNRKADRPDGLHLSGDALREHAQWLVPQVLGAAGRAG